MKFDIKLRPHHVFAFVNFYKKKKYLLSDTQYILEFREKNKQYHNEEFILYWKHFLEYLYKNEDLVFLYIKDFDEVCTKCDINEECNKQNSHLNILVNKLDYNALKHLPLIEGDVYTISYVKQI